MNSWPLAAVIACGLFSLLVWATLAARRKLNGRRFDRARKEFHRRREHLEARFLILAGASGKPRGLRWSECDFDDDVAYARDRRSGELSAFVAATIAFEAIPGGGMEEVEAVGNLRAATAVFVYRRGSWETEGKAVFNLNPAEAIAHFRDHIELIGRETAPAR